MLNVPEAEPAVQGEEEEGQVIGYLDLENAGLQLVEGDNAFYLPPEALGEHVLVAEGGKESQPIIVLVQNSSGDGQTEFTMNHLENAITADGQQVLILSEGASESIAGQEEASNQESGLVSQDGAEESPFEHPAATADSGQAVELQPEPRELPDVNDSESPNVVPEEKAAGSPVAPEENPEGIHGSEGTAEPQAAPLAHSPEKNRHSECSVASESKTAPLTAAPLHEHIEGDTPCKPAALTRTGSQQKNPALPDGELTHNAEEGPSDVTSVSRGPPSDSPSQSPAAVVCAEGAESKTGLLSQEREHGVPVDRSSSDVTTRTPTAVSNKLDVSDTDTGLVKEAGKGNVNRSVQSKANEVLKASDDVASIPDHSIQHGEAKEGNLCTDQSTSEHSSVDAAPTCQPESKSSEKVAKTEPQRTEAASEKPLKKRLRPEIRGETADQAVSLESQLKACKVPHESEKAPLECGSPEGSEERRASSITTACPLHKETEHVVSIHKTKLSGRTSALTEDKVRKLVPSKAREEATSNGDPAPVPNAEVHQVSSLLEETGDAASLREQTKLEGMETGKHITGSESSDKQTGEYCSTVADISPEKPSSPAHQHAMSMVEQSAITQSSNTDVLGEDGPANSATKPAPATTSESTEISRNADVHDHDEPASKPVQPQGHAGSIKQAGVSEKLEAEGPRCLRKKTKENCLGTSPAPAQAEAVVQQDLALLGAEPVQDTKGEHFGSPPCLEQSHKTKTANEAPHKLTEKESCFQSLSDVTTSHEMPKLQQEAVQNHAAGSSMEDELQKSVNGLSSTVLHDAAPGNDQEALSGVATVNALKNASQGPSQTASSSQGSSKLDSREGSLQKESREENSVVRDMSNNGATEVREVEHKEKAPKRRGQDDHLQQEPQSQSSVEELREEKRVLVASSRNDGGRRADVECDTLAAQPSCSWQYEPKPSCSWAVDEYEPKPSCSWQGTDVNVRKGRGRNAKGSGKKLLAALDLVPCHDGSPPGTSRGGKKPLSKTGKRKKQAPKEQVDLKEELPPTKKPWNLRSPKRRKRFIIPDSDDEDFTAYGSDDNPSEAQKIRSEKAFDDLLDNFKTEQAQKAATEAAPVRKRIAKKTGYAPKRKLSAAQSLGTNSVAVGADESSAKASKENTEKSVPKESAAKTSKVKSTERSRPNKSSAKTSQVKSMERSAPTESSAKTVKGKSTAANESSAKTSKAKSVESLAPTESSAKTSKGKSMEKSSSSESTATKTHKVRSTARLAPEKGPQSPVASTSAAAEAQQIRKRHAEPVKALPLKKSAMEDCDDIRMPRIDLRAGDIRIRCQKPSYVSAKLPPRYHCSKCDFVSSRMQNIVWHHKQDCPYTKSLGKSDPKSPKSKSDPKSPKSPKEGPT